MKRTISLAVLAAAMPSATAFAPPSASISNVKIAQKVFARIHSNLKMSDDDVSSRSQCKE
jgi:hypothetical protein